MFHSFVAKNKLLEMDIKEGSSLHLMGAFAVDMSNNEVD